MNGVPDVTQASGLFWATVFGAALGVVAGTVIQYFLTLALDSKSKRKQKSALAKELTYNRSLVDELLSEVQKLRNSLNGGVFEKYFGYFSYEKGIFAQANACAGSGLLYDLLSKEEIRHAQRIVSALNINNANWVNGEITRRRDILLNTPEKFDRAEAVAFVNFLEESIHDLGKWIDDLVKKLQGHR